MFGPINGEIPLIQSENGFDLQTLGNGHYAGINDTETSTAILLQNFNNPFEILIGRMLDK